MFLGLKVANERVADVNLERIDALRQSIHSADHRERRDERKDQRISKPIPTLADRSHGLAISRAGFRHLRSRRYALAVRCIRFV